MVTQYTKNITNSILEVAKKCKNIFEVQTEANVWLGVSKGKKRLSTYFVPDVYFVMRNSRVFIFQLCDSQSANQKEILGDFLSALLAQEIRRIYFIVPPERKAEINQVCKVVNSILKHRFKINKDKLETFVHSIPRGRKQNIKRKIEELALKDNWGYQK